MAPRISSFRTFLSQGRKALLPTGHAISNIAFVDMLAHSWHLGLTSFGGPTVHFQIFRDLFVDKYQWLDHTAYDELFGLCQAFSGPGSTKMIYIINVMHYGLATGVAAFFVWSFPMALASFGLAVGINQVGETLPGPAYALLSGLNSATVGIIALAAVQLSRKAITDTWTRILVFVGATAGMLYNALWYFPVLMVAAGLLTIVWDTRIISRAWKRLHYRRRQESTSRSLDTGMPAGHGNGSGADPELSSLRSRTAQSQVADLDTASTASPPPSRLRHWKSGLAIIAAFLLSFAIVMICRGTLSNRDRGFDLFANLYLAGTIIFGGGPVVIPLLREYIVSPGWVSSRDFLLGLAITQAFPGPNFNFAVYLGALAVQGTGIPPVLGSIIAFLAIFTPGLWIQTGFWSLWQSVRKVQAVRSCLRGVHAAAVGLVFTAVYRLFEIGYLDAEVRNGGSLSRDPWWVVIVATSFVGGMHFKDGAASGDLVGCCDGVDLVCRHAILKQHSPSRLSLAVSVPIHPPKLTRLTIILDATSAGNSPRWFRNAHVPRTSVLKRNCFGDGTLPHLPRLTSASLDASSIANTMQLMAKRLRSDRARFGTLSSKILDPKFGNRAFRLNTLSSVYDKK